MGQATLLQVPSDAEAGSPPAALALQLGLVQRVARRDALTVAGGGRGHRGGSLNFCLFDRKEVSSTAMRILTHQ